MDDAQIDRFSRHILLPEIGGTGQLRLLQARVGVLGEGPAAEAAAMYLCAAGVGEVLVAASLWQACGDHLAAMNPSTTVRIDDNPADDVLRIDPASEKRLAGRSAGAAAAMTAIVTLTEAARYDQWTYDEGGFTWTN